MKSQKLLESTMKALQGKLVEDKFEDDEMDLESALEKIYNFYCESGMQYEFWGDVVNTTGIDMNKIRQWYNMTFEDLEESKKLYKKVTEDVIVDEDGSVSLDTVEDIYKVNDGIFALIIEAIDSIKKEDMSSDKKENLINKLNGISSKIKGVNSLLNNYMDYLEESKKVESKEIKTDLNENKLEERRAQEEIPYGVDYAFDTMVDTLGLDRNDEYFKFGGITRFNNLSVDKLEKLLNDENTKDYINLNGTHNDSPSLKQFYEFMKEHKDIPFACEGYIVSPDREDYPDNDRLEVDGIGVNAENKEAIEILTKWIEDNKIIAPDEFDSYDNTFRAWWD